MRSNQAANHVDLFKGHLRRLGRGQARRHIDGPELPPDPAGPQARDVGVKIGRGFQIGRQIDRMRVVSVVAWYDYNRAVRRCKCQVPGGGC